MSMTSTADPRCAIRERLDPTHRSTFTNLHLDIARSGETDSLAIVSAATRGLQARANTAAEYADNASWAAAVHALAVLRNHPEEAEDFARWCVEWVRLPREERERQKAARGDEHRRAWMDTQPATEKQVAYCRSLGHRGPIRSRAHASEIIDTLKRRRAS